MLFSRDRRDGVYLRRLAPYKKFIPWIMPRINDAVIYYKMQADLSITLPFIQTVNGRGEHITLFQLLIAALLRTGVEIPELNRFVSGFRIYERKGYSTSFTLKTDSGDATARVCLKKADTVEEISQKILEKTDKARQKSNKPQKDIFDFIQHLPRFIIRFVMWLWRVLDHYDLLPSFIMEMAPMYCSVYVANLGYYGIDAPFHHLFEYGNVSLFVTLGQIHKEYVTTTEQTLELREVVNLGITLDERIVSGAISAKAVTRLKELIENPSLLEQPPMEEDDGGN